MATTAGTEVLPSALGAVLARGRLRATLSMLGPAFVAAIAYVDPGNFAANFQAGSRFGYALLWVVVLASLMAMLVQYLSAKLGVVTGADLPTAFRRHYPAWTSWAMWAQAEVVAMATDVAEFLGAAVGLNLIFHVPLLAAGVITGVVAIALLELRRHGFRPYELAVAGLFGIILLGFLYATLRIGPSATGAARGLLPSIHNGAALYLAVAIIGATVMPHAIYLHSALTNDRLACRDDEERRRVLRFARIDVGVALGLAGLVNMAMLAVAARLFAGGAMPGSDTLTAAHGRLAQVVGGGAALAFAVALLASGVSSGSVGTYAGQVVMAGFVDLRVRLVVRRLVTMAPAFVVLAAGVSPTSALVLSQVVLSFGVPFALIPLVLLTGRRDVMGALANRGTTTVLAWTVVAVVTGMNVVLIGRALGVG